MSFSFVCVVGGRGEVEKKNDQHYNEWVLFFHSVNMQYLCRCHGESTALSHKGLSKLTNQTWMFMNHVYMLAFVDLISELWNYCMRHFEFSCCLYPFSPYVYSTGTIKMKIRMIVSGWRKNGQLERYGILPRGPCWWSYF